jgi:hypothetical protein
LAFLARQQDRLGVHWNGYLEGAEDGPPPHEPASAFRRDRGANAQFRAGPPVRLHRGDLADEHGVLLAPAQQILMAAAVHPDNGCEARHLAGDLPCGRAWRAGLT